eukprot:Opistho-1_new@16202
MTRVDRLQVAFLNCERGTRVPIFQQASPSPVLLQRSTKGEEKMGACVMFDHDYQCSTVLGVRRAMGILSLCGTFFVVSLILAFKRYHRLPQRMILALNLAAMAETIAYIMGNTTDSTHLCRFQAFWLLYFDWAVLLWVCAITGSLTANVLFEKIVPDHFEIRFHAVCWGFPAAVTIVPFAASAYGPAGLWCWIDDQHHWLRFILWYVPFAAVVVALFVVYSIMVSRVYRRASRWEGTYDGADAQRKQAMKKQIKPLRYYPLIFLASAVPGLINRIQNAADPNHRYFGLVLLQATFSPLFGFFLALAFGLQTDALRRCNWAHMKSMFHAARKPDFGKVREFQLTPSGSRQSAGDVEYDKMDDSAAADDDASEDADAALTTDSRAAAAASPSSSRVGDSSKGAAPPVFDDEADDADFEGGRGGRRSVRESFRMRPLASFSLPFRSKGSSSYAKMGADDDDRDDAGLLK